MNARQRLTWSTWLMLCGVVLCLGWFVVSVGDLFDLTSGSGGIWKVLRSLGPIGMGFALLGGILCRWDLPALRREVKDD